MNYKTGLLYKIHTTRGYYYEYRYEEAVKYFNQNDGIVIMGFTKKLFPEWYVIETRIKPNSDWFIMNLEDINQTIYKRPYFSIYDCFGLMALAW